MDITSKLSLKIYKGIVEDRASCRRMEWVKYRPWVPRGSFDLSVHHYPQLAAAVTSQSGTSWALQITSFCKAVHEMGTRPGCPSIFKVESVVRAWYHHYIFLRHCLLSESEFLVKFLNLLVIDFVGRNSSTFVNPLGAHVMSDAPWPEGRNGAQSPWQ